MARNKPKTKPEVFIIETLRIEDERKQNQEGELISRMLHLAGKRKSKYYYIRTPLELEKIIDIFGKSQYRYLHLSCHADKEGMATTFGDITYADLGKMLRGHLEGRRVFVSACEMATDGLAKQILPSTGCFSLIGPDRGINFDDAGAFWISFYHLMFKSNNRGMKGEHLRNNIKQLSLLYDVSISYFVASEEEKSGYRKVDVYR